MLNAIFSKTDTQSTGDTNKIYEEACKAATIIRDVLDQKISSTRMNFKPSYGIICGSGLHAISDIVRDSVSIPYSQIPGLPQSKVEGHTNQITCGNVSGKAVVCFQGRFHHYEGYPMSKIVMPIRIMKLLGVHTIFITNVSGGVNPIDFADGDIMVLKDHINFTGQNPLIGANDPRWGTRFPDLNNAYDLELRNRCLQIAQELNIKNHVKEGIYFMLVGPSYETKAESKAVHRMGGDAVGMSTIPEVITARHCDIRVCALSLITTLVNYDNYTDPEKDKICHEYVLEIADKGGKDLANLIREMIRLD